MTNTWAVCKREFSSFFFTPIGYIIVGIFAAITGLGFTASLLQYAQMSQAPHQFQFESVPDFEETFLSPFLVFCGMMILFLSPLVTMRLLAEERHRGTIELLLTYPLTDRDIVFGKFGAALGMLLVMMAVIGVHLLLVFTLMPVEPLVLLFGLVAVFLMGSACLSLGLFVSALTPNQTTAGTLTFGLHILLYILGALAESLPEENPAPEALPAALRNAAGAVYRTVAAVFQQVRLDTHAEEMASGMFRPQDIVYYIAVSAFFLFLTFRALESRNWRG